MATDTGIVTIYDLENESKPLTTHRIDAREFLAHESGRWSTSPDKKKNTVSDAEPKETGGDTGEEMKLKGMNFKQLYAMAQQAEIEGYGSMNKAELVEAIIKLKEQENVE